MGRNNRWALTAIGAGTVVLALIAFSGICWGTLSACGLCGVSWGYWEVFGISGAGMLMLLAVRPIGRRWRETKLRKAKARRAMESATRPALCNENNDSWRALCDQLSETERQELKALMGKYCAGEENVQEDERPGK